MRRVAYVAVLAFLAALSAPVAAAPPPPPVPPPTLTGENLNGSPTITSASCDPAGQSTFTYHIAGVAGGPYSGTFEETGVVVVGPQPGFLPGGFPLVSFTATFSISSPIGEVRGTKTLGPASFNGGLCQEPVHFATASGLRYTAFITTATGVWRDEGSGNLGSVGSPVPGTLGFSEGFVSDLLQPVFVGKVKRGRGCGDENHEHERRDECPHQ